MKRLTIFYILIFWPLSLFLANTATDFYRFTIPLVLIVLSTYLKNKFKYSYYLILLIPFVEPKLALFPICYIFTDLIYAYCIDKSNFRKNLLYKILGTIVSILILLFSFNNFYGQSILKDDYEAGQKVIRDQLLYPTPFTARLFHNKVRIRIDKLTDNLFELVDLNNYFYGFAPRQIIGRNQNLNKFPFLSLPFFLVGLYYLGKSKFRSTIVIVTIASLLSLVPLGLYDRNDFIIYFPFTLTVIHGLKEFVSKYNWSKYYLYIFIVISTVELIKIYLGFL